MALDDHIALIDALVRDDLGVIGEDERLAAIGAAALRLGIDRPNVTADLMEGDGTASLPAPEGWQAGYSRVVSLEYPVGADPESFLGQPADFRVSELPEALGGTTFVFKSAPSTGADVRVEFTVRHQVDAEADTVPAELREVFCCYAAALLLDQLAARSAGTSDPLIQADVVDRQGASGRYAARARDLRRRYFGTFGLDADGQAASPAVKTKPAGTVVPRPAKHAGLFRVQR